jgi:hypothetical protein
VRELESQIHNPGENFIIVIDFHFSFVGASTTTSPQPTIFVTGGQ